MASGYEELEGVMSRFSLCSQRGSPIQACVRLVAIHSNDHRRYGDLMVTL